MSKFITIKSPITASGLGTPRLRAAEGFSNHFLFAVGQPISFGRTSVFSSIFSLVLSISVRLFLCRCLQCDQKGGAPQLLQRRITAKFYSPILNFSLFSITQSSFYTIENSECEALFGPGAPIQRPLQPPIVLIQSMYTDNFDTFVLFKLTTIQLRSCFSPPQKSLSKSAPKIMTRVETWERQK